MANALDYLDWRGDLDFAVSPFNEVDMFLCSQLSTPDYSRILDYEDSAVSVKEISDKYFATNSGDKTDCIGTLQSNDLLPMLSKIGKTQRYEQVRLCHPVYRVIKENTEQFSAVTVELPDGTIVVSYRGTDDTIIGWKEDFYFAVHDTVHAQRDAVMYLEDVARRHSGQAIALCGHSKGGNLAVYAAAKAPQKIQNRLVKVYNFDGPGFQEKFLESKGYGQVKDRVVTVLSQNSLVGTLLQRAGTVKYVISDENWGLAHDGFTWQVLGTQFVPGTGLAETSQLFGDTINGALDGMSLKNRKAFVDNLFDILLAHGTTTVTQLANSGPFRTIEILRELSSNKEVGRFAKAILEYAIGTYGKQFK